jgi:ketosteroid isomerase-like protein
MSQENVEIVRRVLTEFDETQQLSDAVASDFVWDLSSWAVWTGQPKFHGRDAFMQFFAEWIGAYEEWTNEVEGFIDAGGSHVVVRAVQHARLRGSDSWVDLRAAHLYTVEDGVIRSGAVFTTPNQALEAAGLSA